MQATMNTPLHFRSTTFSGPQPGTKLIVLGAVHGNETCGTQAIQRMLAEFESGQRQLCRGSVTFVPVANPLAYAKQARSGDRNLNRCLFPNAQPQDYEDRIANWLCPLLAAHDVLLDLHSFHTDGDPFALMGPLDNNGALQPFAHAAAEEALALRLGVHRFVDGWLETYASGIAHRQQHPAHYPATLPPAQLDVRYGIGTTEYMRTRGGWGITLECGQHDEAQAPAVAYQAIANTLAHLALVDAPLPTPAADPQHLRMVTVTDRYDSGDRFARRWQSFDFIPQGEAIGWRADGSVVTAAHDAYILFPNPDAEPGAEWFYLAQQSDRF